ncbi:hypothetical protein AUC71_08425 [Methyloceanibacter marginalis]|jgi:ElaB/YqjD/DUF883 family membrane-anchored ribosome-binding protein|uniref:DUF883 domain-containing protein n=1 Tax=Methyloceanibacter marginalis TaxID=1774971 RepID=A0A1E3WCZ1_9HYPH|nr:hypothetical protein [Methyloceanibacter marginalis]ODS03668.1 hypothetical protein AUC71_08425 [Methyloceanibacter marginalis]
MWGLAERKTSRFGRDFDVSDLYDQLDTLRGYVQDLTQDAGKSASHSYGRARDFASATAHDAEDVMKDNLAASLLLTLGFGVVIGFLISRSSK